MIRRNWMSSYTPRLAKFPDKVIEYQKGKKGRFRLVYGRDNENFQREDRPKKNQSAFNKRIRI
jgi:hypothetical protein